MSDQRIDGIFNERLGNGSIPVPDHLWDRLEPFLPEPGKRDRGAWIWWIGLGTVLVSAILLWATLVQPIGNEKTPVSSVALIDVDIPDIQKRTMTADASPVVEDKRDKIASSNQKSAHNSLAPAARSMGMTDEVIFRKGNIAEVVTRVNSDAGMNVAITPSDFDAGDSELEHARPERTSRMPFLMFADFDLETAQRKLPDPAKECYDFGGRRSGGGGVLLAEAYTGPTFSTRKLSSRLEDVSGYIAKRDSTESRQLSWNAGVRVGYVHASGISVRLGAHYTVVNELFDYFDGSWSQTTTRIDTIRDASGNIIDTDTILVTETGKRIKTTHNHFHSIDIPLLIGYQGSRDHWTYGIQAGPVLNIMHRKKGDMFSASDMIVSFTDSDPAPYAAFRDHLGLSIYAGVHLGRRIGYRTMIYAEPHVHHRLRSITQDIYPVEQRQTNIGLSIGLRVALN